jgi:hypothetical protein
MIRGKTVTNLEYLCDLCGALMGERQGPEIDPEWNDLLDRPNWPPCPEGKLVEIDLPSGKTIEVCASCGLHLSQCLPDPGPSKEGGDS